ncbi:MAG: hypothetical protein P4L31_04040 [Candidatus Babeliales bacterium]|nr:hypothetical protein [Candidatus Babeliales bacterium]
MCNKQHKPGYIFLLTLMIMSLATVLVSYVFTSGSIHVPFIKTMIDREKAKQLALGGIQIAISQLSQEVDASQDAKNEQAKPDQPDQSKKPKLSPTASSEALAKGEDQANKKLFETVIPTLNRWQQFPLSQEVDGVDGQIKICVMSEEGKININALYDFKKHTYKGTQAQQEIGKVLLKETFKSIGKEDLFEQFEKYLKDRSYRLDDVTELMSIKGFEAFKNNIFYQPPPLQQMSEKSSQAAAAQFDQADALESSNQASGTQKGKKKVYLTDIFTVWSGRFTVDPWLLSDSLCALLGVKRAERGDIEGRKQAVEQIAKEFKSTFQFPADWKKYFEPLYGTDFKSLSKGVEYILNTKFEPKIFSVLSYGSVGSVTLKMLAILQREKTTKDKRIAYSVTIKKIYWL